MKNQDVQQAHEFMIDYILSIQRHCRKFGISNDLLNIPYLESIFDRYHSTVMIISIVFSKLEMFNVI